SSDVCSSDLQPECSLVYVQFFLIHSADDRVTHTFVELSFVLFPELIEWLSPRKQHLPSFLFRTDMNLLVLHREIREITVFAHVHIKSLYLLIHEFYVQTSYINQFHILCNST